MQHFFKGMPTTWFELSMLATQYRSAPIYQSFRDLNERLSMLHPDVLALLYHYGACASGQILELGPYVGGSTISLARGVKDANGSTRITSIEKGGRYEHPTFSTTDIVESLRTNLTNYGVADKVDLIVGHSRDPTVLNQLAEVSRRNGKFACLVLDADGRVEEDVELYRPYLVPRCYLVVDDYYAPGAPEKEETTRHNVDSLQEKGLVESFGVHGWGTWFGRFL